jgi:poly-gamma-glutamate capsule biosynthesis protein CapA/YwtB (metallophosphatase superfamily)
LPMPRLDRSTSLSVYAMRLAIAGDTMLGRGVAEALTALAPTSLVEPELAALLREADATVLNLECCVSDRGVPVRLPGKSFFFRAPPRAVELLAYLGVDCVTLANNHALDFGEGALLDTLHHLQAAGIAWVGAGPDLAQARLPVTLTAEGEDLTVIGFTDHPAAFAAGPARPGVAYVDPDLGLDPWIGDAISRANHGCVLISPHWGPNMTTEPSSKIRSMAHQLLRSGASLIAGHSAHVFHGVEGTVLYDIGDFLDDYRVDPVLRNDLGLLFLIDIVHGEPQQLEGVPLKLDYCYTQRATGTDARWIKNRFKRACAAFGHEVTDVGSRLMLTW